MVYNIIKRVQNKHISQHFKGRIDRMIWCNVYYKKNIQRRRWICLTKKRNLRKISKRAVKLEKKTPGEGLSYVDKPKNVDSSKLSPTGRIRAGSKKVTITEGGAYATYKKKSAPAKSFRKAFAAAKGKDFTWDGRKYSGKTKEQAAKAKAKT